MSFDGVCVQSMSVTRNERTEYSERTAGVKAQKKPRNESCKWPIVFVRNQIHRSSGSGRRRMLKLSDDLNVKRHENNRPSTSLITHIFFKSHPSHFASPPGFIPRLICDCTQSSSRCRRLFILRLFQLPVLFPGSRSRKT